MKLENQVCSPEQGKRLMELGVSNNSLFHHIIEETALGIENRIAYLASPPNKFRPAFTVAELGVMLPLRCISVRQVMNDSFACLHMNKNNNDVDYKYGIKAADAEAQARAAMLIYLLENNIITAAECNERLNAA